MKMNGSNYKSRRDLRHICKANLNNWEQGSESELEKEETGHGTEHNKVAEEKRSKKTIKKKTNPVSLLFLSKL